MMVQANDDTNRRRIQAAIGVAVVHALLGYALIHGLGFEISLKASDDRLKLFDVALEPPPPPIEEALPAEPRAPDPEGAAAPPNLKATPTPVVVPPPVIRLPAPSPVVAAPVPGPGSDASAGASDKAGPGTGAGGEGTGTGSGRAGSGDGGGGAAIRARHLRGDIRNSDYPDAAGDAGVEGSVLVLIYVGADGGVDDCRVERSSGNAELDWATCRLVRRRFSYAPARDAQGRAVPDILGWNQDWWIGRRKRRR